jgi:hypothetical protein
MLGDLPDLQKYLRFDNIKIDNYVFRLHYKLTVAVFVAAGILVTSHQYIGDPIDCIVDGIPGDIMDTYCWIHSTFSIPSRWTGKEGVHVPHPGISPIADLNDGTEVKYHKWYQWVAFFMCLQVLFFFLPRYLWKASENGKVAMLVGNLQEPLLSPSDKEGQINEIVKYFRMHRGTHSLYAARFFLLEVFNFINVISQIYFIDYFLDYEFRTYGSDVLNYTGMEAEDRPDPMAKVFPKVTKCTFHKYGPSGTVEKKDGLCVLPLNIINEKMFIFIWFWLILVAVISGIQLVYRLAILMAPHIRVFLITVHGGRSVRRSDVEAILDPASLSYGEKLGDWFLLHLVCKNLNVLLVNDLIKQLHKAEEGSNSNTETMKLRDPHMTSQV